MRLEGRRLSLFAVALGSLAFLLAGCAPQGNSLTRVSTARAAVLPLTPAPQVAGDPNRGRRLFTDSHIVAPSGCGSCHTIRGVPEATGVIGPNLTNVSLRPTLAGETIPNSAENLARWIVDPAAMKQGALMPKLGVSEQDARDLAAFIYSQPYNPPAR